MAREWVINTRLEDTPRQRRDIALLVRHAYLKYGNSSGGMKNETPSEFLRFLIDYYYSREIQNGGR